MAARRRRVAATRMLKQETAGGRQGAEQSREGREADNRGSIQEAGTARPPGGGALEKPMAEQQTSEADKERRRTGRPLLHS